VTRVLVPADRIYACGGRLRLEPDEAHYLLRVLRLGIGATIEVRDGRGGAWRASLVDEHHLSLDERTTLPPLTGVGVVLAFAPPRGGRIDILLEKATEMGAGALQPVWASRSVRKDSGNPGRWSRIVTAAAKQCGIPVVPDVAKPIEFVECLQAYAKTELRLIATPHAEQPLRAVLPTGAIEQAIVLTGPEGGFTEAEVEAARSVGFLPFHLGPQVLRAETAPLVALTILRHRFGDLG
jgi:16S rRNA (uracil1498-N3)-methyltransferase